MSADGSSARVRTGISIRLADVEPEQVRWLWRGRIPRGKLTFVDGDPGLGKSLLTLDIAAHVSTGSSFPDGAPCDAGNVVLFSAEDGLADTVVPRLRAAGADLSRIHTIPVVPVPGGPSRLPDIVKDAALIELEVTRLGGAALIVIDPLNAYLPSDVNTWNDHHIRRALAPFVQLAERTGAAVLVVRHLNKRESSKAIYRGGGSIGFVAAARAAFLVAEDTADSSLRVFAAVKMNLAPKPLSLTYRIEVVDEIPRVEWVGVSERTADELLEEPEHEGKSELNRAMQYLREVLQDGPVPVQEVKKRAAGCGISERTLKRAKRSLGVIATHEGFGSGSEWVWSLPKEGQAANTDGWPPMDPEPLSEAWQRCPKHGLTEHWQCEIGIWHCPECEPQPY